MKKREKVVYLLLGYSIGISIGTVISFFFTEDSFIRGAYWGAIILSPFIMLSSAPIVFAHFSHVGAVFIGMGIFIVFGSHYLLLFRNYRWASITNLLGTALWNSWNIPVFYALMSV